MRIFNEHRRVLPGGTVETVGALLDTLATTGDQLWPRECWPPMVLRGGKIPGTVGGHGPIRYRVETYEPGRGVLFRFLAPKGFDGTHGFTIEAEGAEVTLVHVIDMRVMGSAMVSWPLVFRPLHDALLEDGLDKAEAAITGEEWRRRRWTPWVRGLRWFLARARRRSSPNAGAP